MAGYRVNLTVYKDPTGKTIKGPTFVHFLGDLCSGLGLIGILEAILAVMEHYGTVAVIVGIVMAAVGFAMNKKAKKDAEAAFLKVLVQQEGRTANPKKSD